MNLIKLNTYNVFIGSLEKSLHEVLQNKEYSQVGILVDENTRQYCLPILISMLDDLQVIEVKSGESNKSIETCSYIWGQMMSFGFDRHSLLINLGGGVIGDMGGFAASCYMRGIDFLQIPTTLLSQVDASVGGKLGVDFNNLKNFIGLFNDPIGVLVDPRFLQTLPVREMRSGFSEMIKHALIADKEIWNSFSSETSWRNVINEEQITKSISVKQRVVEYDPIESGQRKILNFGHTIGHAIESIALRTENPLLHGEAIALGMMVEVFLSVDKVGLDQQSSEQVINYLSAVYSDIGSGYLNNVQEVIELIQKDKKNKSGKLLFSLLEEIGKCTYDVEVQEDEIYHSIRKTQLFLNQQQVNKT